jgi:hypothetical protein
MENVIAVNSLFGELSYEEMLYVNGGVDKIVLAGGIAAVGIGVVAVGISAGAGFVVGGPAGAIAAGGACAKVVAPLVIGGVAAIALSLRY